GSVVATTKVTAMPGTTVTKPSKVSWSTSLTRTPTSYGSGARFTTVMLLVAAADVAVRGLAAGSVSVLVAVKVSMNGALPLLLSRLRSAAAPMLPPVTTHVPGAHTGSGCEPPIISASPGTPVMVTDNVSLPSVSVSTAAILSGIKLYSPPV